MVASTSAPPTTLPVKADNIPAALKERQQFVGWDWKFREGQWTKPLINPRTGNHASHSKPADWGTLDEALACAVRRGLPGIGYVFSADDPYVGVDLDKCRNPETGEIEPWAAEIVEGLDSYSDVSPTRTGVHIICEATIPAPSGRRKGAIEIYHNTRFFTMTGHRLPDTPAKIRRRQSQVDDLWTETFGPADPPDPPPSSNGHQPNGGLSDSDVIRLASSARNSSNFNRLFYDGDTSGHNADDSLADDALCVHLAFWTGGDKEQIERLMNRSALSQRDKWNRPDYRKRTIDDAVAKQTEHYKAPTTSPARPDNEPTPIRPLDIKPWPVIDPRAFHGLAGDIARAFDPHIEADPIATLVSFFALFGTAINRSAHFFAGEDRHGANEFYLLVGDTSKARKGSSLSGPRRVFDLADPQFMKERVQGGLSSGEGLIWAVRDPIYKTNKKGETECIDEGIADHRILPIEEEFSTVLKHTGRQGNTLSEIVRKSFDSREVIASMTKNSPARSTNAHVSILAHITKEELTRELTETSMANGLANRFGMFLVRRSKLLPESERLSDQCVSELASRVRSALDFSRRSGLIKRNDEAKEIWRGIYPTLSKAKPGLAGALTARSEAHTARYALIYALLDESSEIRAEHMEAALMLWDYVEQSVDVIFGDIVGDVMADRLLSALRSNGAMSQNDIFDLFGRNVASGRIGQALEVLVLNKKVTSQREETGGRPRTIWEAIA